MRTEFVKEVRLKVRYYITGGNGATGSVRLHRLLLAVILLSDWLRVITDDRLRITD